MNRLFHQDESHELLKVQDGAGNEAYNMESLKSYNV